MEYTTYNTRPLLQESDSDTESLDLRSQSYEECVVIKDTKPLFRGAQEPRDRYMLAYGIFSLLGMTTLLPWNFFVTADDYWMYKFRSVAASNNTTTYNDGQRTPLQAEFTSYLSVASSLPNIVFLALTTAYAHRISLQARMIGSLLLMLALFLTTTVCVRINTDLWQETFFAITLSSVVVLNIASAVMSGSLFGIIGKFSPQYITATVGGQALGGVFAAVAQILSLAIGISSTFSAFVYFMVGNAMIIISLICYMILSKTVFFKFHIAEKTDSEVELLRPRVVCHVAIFKKIWPHALSAFLVFAITLSVYPGVTVLVESEYKASGSSWSNIYFVPVVAYLIFSCGDYIGRLAAGYVQRPRNVACNLLLNAIRIVLIPLMVVCNAQPRHSTIPVLIDKDNYYILVIIVCAVSNGYLANLAALCVPRLVDHHEKEAASAMVTLFIGIGLGVGSATSLLIVKLL